MDKKRKGPAGPPVNPTESVNPLIRYRPIAPHSRKVSQYSLAQGHVGSVNIRLQLFYGGGANNGAGHKRFGQRPRNRHLGGVKAMLAGYVHIGIGGLLGILGQALAGG